MNNEKNIQSAFQQKGTLPKQVEEKINDTYSIIRNEKITMKQKRTSIIGRLSTAAALFIFIGLLLTVSPVRASIANILALWSNSDNQSIEQALQRGVYQNVEGISTESNGITANVVTVFSDANHVGVTFMLDFSENTKIVLEEGDSGGFDYTIAKNDGELLFAFPRVETSPLKPYNPYNLQATNVLYEVDGDYYYNVFLSATDSLFENTTSIQFKAPLLTLHEKSGFTEYEGDWSLTIPIEPTKGTHTYSPMTTIDTVKINQATSTPFGFVIDYVFVNQSISDETQLTTISLVDENSDTFKPTHGVNATITEEGTRVVVFVESPFYNQSEMLTLQCVDGTGTSLEIPLVRD